MFGWGVLTCGIPELVRFCIGDFPMYTFFIPTHPYVLLFICSATFVYTKRMELPLGLLQVVTCRHFIYPLLIYFIPVVLFAKIIRATAQVGIA